MDVSGAQPDDSERTDTPGPRASTPNALPLLRRVAQGYGPGWLSRWSAALSSTGPWMFRDGACPIQDTVQFLLDNGFLRAQPVRDQPYREEVVLTDHGVAALRTAETR